MIPVSSIQRSVSNSQNQRDTAALAMPIGQPAQLTHTPNGAYAQAVDQMSGGSGQERGSSVPHRQPVGRGIQSKVVRRDFGVLAEADSAS